MKNASNATYLQDKRQGFLGGELQADRTLSSADLPSVSAGQPAFLKGALFERGVGLSCPVLPAGSSVFFGAYSYMNGGGYLRNRPSAKRREPCRDRCRRHAHAAP